MGQRFRETSKANQLLRNPFLFLEELKIPMKMMM